MKKSVLLVIFVAIVLVFACCQSSVDSETGDTQPFAQESKGETETSDVGQTARDTTPEESIPAKPTPTYIDDDELAFELVEHYAGSHAAPVDVDLFLRWRTDSYNEGLDYKYDPYHGHASIVCTNYDTQSTTFFDKSLKDPFWIQYVFSLTPCDVEYQRLCKLYSQEYENKRALVKVLDYGDGVITGSHGEEIFYVYKSYDYTKCSYFPYKRPRYNATGLINVELYLMMPVNYGGVEGYVQANLLVDIKRGDYEAMLEQYKDVLCEENFCISHRDNDKFLHHMAEAGVHHESTIMQWFMLAGAEQIKSVD